MHPVWYVSELQQNIVQYLEPRDLYRVAQTSKESFHIATDILWESLKSFSPLLSCLPSDRPFTPDEVDRLDFYADKVRNLFIAGGESQLKTWLPLPFEELRKAKIKNRPKRAGSHYYDTWEELWDAIRTIRPSTRFLPNLRCLRVNNIVEDLLFPLVGVSGTNLTRIYIGLVDVRCGGTIVPQFLEQLQDTPKLRFLFVRDGEPDVIPMRLIQQSPLDHLRLDPRHCPPDRLGNVRIKEFPLRQGVLQKKSVEKLSIGLTRKWYNPDLTVSDKKYLPALRKLWLDLATIMPGNCIPSCINVTANGWTCEDNNTNGLFGTTTNAVFSGASIVDCGKRPPSAFVALLDQPELDLLVVKLPPYVTGPMFLEVVDAFLLSCRLESLTELALAGGGWTNLGLRWQGAEPMVRPSDLEAAMRRLMPLPKLKSLRLYIAPGLVDSPDKEFNKALADGLPALETLVLGHADFCRNSGMTEHADYISYYEKTPQRYLAAFCTRFPKLRHVEVGTLDVSATTQNRWAGNRCVSPGVTSLVAANVFWPGQRYSFSGTKDELAASIPSYFPNADMTWGKTHVIYSLSGQQLELKLVY